MDTPGHPAFEGEVSAAVRLADGIVLVIDVVMGVSTYIKRILETLL